MIYYFVAVNYNNAFYTKKYIESVCAIEKKEGDLVRIIIVDNNSGDDDISDLLSFCKNIECVNVIRSKKNQGYFSGLNKGLSEIKEKSDCCVLIGNNDLEFDREFIHNWHALVVPENVMVICPRVTTIDGVDQNPHVVNKVPQFEKIKSWLYFRSFYLLKLFRVVKSIVVKIAKKNVVGRSKDYEQPQYIKRGIGACYILTPLFFEVFDRLDDSVFLWGEEVLLSSQIESKNGRMYYFPRLKVLHHESVSVKKFTSKQKYKILKKSYNIYKNDL